MTRDEKQLKKVCYRKRLYNGDQSTCLKNRPKTQKLLESNTEEEEKQTTSFDTRLRHKLDFMRI